MACPTGDPLIDAISGFFDFLDDPIGTIVSGIAHAILAAAVSAFGELTMSIPTLSTTSTTPQQVNGQTQWVVVYLAVGSLLFAAIRMAFERRGEAGTTALKGLLRVILVAGAATTVVTAMAKLSDRYADHLFTQAASETLQDNIGCQNSDGIEAFLLLILAFLLLIAAILHTILLYIRLGVMLVLLGTLPLAAAASMTDWGNGWWRKHIGWMIAWLLYKPAAALVMYAGAAMISNDQQNGVQERIAGIGVMLLSAVALPALLKLIVPATAGLGGGNGVGDGVTAAGGAVASGAKSVASGSGGSGGGSAGKAGPSGAPAASGGAGAAGSEGGAGAPGGQSAAGDSGSAGRPPAGGPPGGTGAAGAGTGSTGAGAGATGAGTAGGTGAAAAAGPAGLALSAAMSAAQGVGRIASGALDGADGDAGHNR
ncbi:hypothetical protein ACF058_03505 [Streptomyces sp. NPDC015501]|uniref:hypothetical protein n=1 Tax=unclassified Streptomyces TaxID=2593676 RepID=UPI0011A5E71C|nr:hypothetical protein A3L22_03470 [Streptomyces griseus subsp. griseus]WSS57724.1 hypothetical protein OG543_21305 [Streptomyces sp. NBC_01178]